MLEKMTTTTKYYEILTFLTIERKLQRAKGRKTMEASGADTGPGTVRI
jgi:hypothetical protein